MHYSKHLNFHSSLFFIFVFFATVSFVQNVSSKSFFGPCGDSRHSWDPIDGTAKLDINSKTIDIQVTGKAKDTLYGSSTSTTTNYTTKATALYIFSTLSFQNSVNDTDLCASLGSCPVPAGNVTLSKVLSLPRYCPFIDVHITTFLIDENHYEYGCFTVITDQTDEPYNKIIVIVVLCTLVLPIIALAFGYLFGNVRDILTYTSNLGVNGRTQSFKYPGFFDMVYHLQFLAVTGLLNLDYILFYQKFLFRLHSILGILGDSVTNGGAIKAQLSPNEPIENRGIPFFSHFMELEPSGLLISLLIFMGFVLFAVLFVSGVINGVAVLVMRSDGAYYSRKKLFAFTLGNILRFVLLFHLPITLFAFNQLMIHDPMWLTVVAAVLVVVLGLTTIAGALLYLTKISPASIIFIDTFYMLVFGPLYNDYTSKSYRYAWVRFSHHIVLAAIIAFGQSNGLVQLILLLCLEVAAFYACTGVHPYVSRSVNFWEATFQAFRVTLVALLFVYLPAVKASNEAKEWCGLTSIFLILIFQLCWVIRIFVCLVKIPIDRYTKQNKTNDISLAVTSTSPLPARPRGVSSHISGTTSIVSTVGVPKIERPFASESVHDTYKPKNENPSYASLPDGVGLSPYDRYMANLRESAGLRQEVLIDDTTDTRSSANLSVSTFTPKPVYSSHHSQPSQSSFTYEDLPQIAYPRDSSGSQRPQASLPKFFSANNN